MAARDDGGGEQLSEEDVRVQLHDAREGQPDGTLDGEYEEDIPSSGSEGEENVALLGKTDARDSDSVKDKEDKRKSMEQLNSIEQNERNENRQRIIESSEKASRAKQALCTVPKKEEEEQISGSMLEANLLSRGVSGLYCLLVFCLSVIHYKLNFLESHLCPPVSWFVFLDRKTSILHRPSGKGPSSIRGCDP